MENVRISYHKNRFSIIRAKTFLHITNDYFESLESIITHCIENNYLIVGQTYYKQTNGLQALYSNLLKLKNSHTI